MTRVKGALTAMDTLRGNFDATDLDANRHAGSEFDTADYDAGQDNWPRDWDVSEEDAAHEPPPIAIGTDERRMQVRAYNHWASLLNDRNFPSIEDLDPENLPDFGPYSVLLDFTSGIENPGVQYVGAKLADECGTHEEIDSLSDVPSRSLLSRITDHYMQILANQAPIGFEAEFVNQRGATILYRGILLPFSSDDEGIDFIYGVINWKEMADQITTDELMLEIDQALEATDSSDEFEEDELDPVRQPDAVSDWADGPAADIFDLGPLDQAEAPQDNDYPEPSFGSLLPQGALSFGTAGGSKAKEPVLELSDEQLEEETEAFELVDEAEPADVPSSAVAEPEDDEQYLDALAAAPSDDEGLYDCLAAARELAHAARSCEDRSRNALYAAVGRAYDFSLAAAQEPDEFDELVTENGLTVQDRAPMTPVVKLVFGAEYDKTRLTEYAAVLSHAHRIGIERGALAGFLAKADGGLKGVVHTERQMRREESAQTAEHAESPQEKLLRKLRDIAPAGFETITSDGEEFALVMIRRMPSGEVVMLGEITGDQPLVERAARKLVA